jgi:hypothetical protein
MAFVSSHSCISKGILCCLEQYGRFKGAFNFDSLSNALWLIHLIQVNIIKKNYVADHPFTSWFVSAENVPTKP